MLVNYKIKPIFERISKCANMILALTEQQIDALAPDAASIKAGRGLATVTKWPLLGYSQEAIWGHCRGSGSSPYQTAIDLGAMAFKCSCPSRKFPCKHALALMYIAVGQASAVSESENPDWVATWLTKRQQNATKQQEKAERQEASKPVNTQAQAKRKEQRHQRVLEGIEDLQLWLKDIIRAGLMHLPQPFASVVAGMARRMIDAQASGLAGALYRIGAIDLSKENWERRLLEELSLLYLLSESYKHIESLDPVWQSEIRSLIGFTQSKEEVLNTGGILDDWQVLYTSTTEQDKLIRTTYWLMGYHTGRMATYSEFRPIHLRASSETALLGGATYSGTLHFYTSVLGHKALLGEVALKAPHSSPQGYRSISTAQQAYRSALAQQPFIHNYPVVLEEVYLARQGEVWGLADSTDTFQPIRYNEACIVTCLSLWGGSAMQVFVLATKDQWQICATWRENTYKSWDIVLDDE